MTAGEKDMGDFSAKGFICFLVGSCPSESCDISLDGLMAVTL